MVGTSDSVYAYVTNSNSYPDSDGCSHWSDHKSQCGKGGLQDSDDEMPPKGHQTTEECHLPIEILELGTLPIFMNHGIHLR